MKTTPLWRVLLLLVIVSLACSFTSQGSYLPPTETPQAVADDDQDEEEEEQDQEEEEDQEEEDVDLDQDLDLGGLGGDDEEDQDEEEQDQEEEEEQDQEEEEEQDQEEEEEQDQEEEEEQDQEEEEEEQDQGDDCSPFQASSDVFWVTLNDDFEIEEQVTSYPSGATLITPVFEYDCIPSNVDLVSVFSYEGEVVYSDEESLQSNTRAGIYGYPLGTTDDSPLGDGEWGVEFYVDDNLVAGGNVQVGGGGDSGQDQTTNELVPVEGSVVSASSGQPIEDALVLILIPGVTVQEWVDADYPDSDVYTSAESNSRGEFTLEEPLERNVGYSLVVVADGFQPLAVDEFVIGDDLEPPVFLEIELAE